MSAANKVAVVLLAGNDTPGDMGRMVNALMTAREMIEAGDEVTVILDGAGVTWVAELADPTHRYRRLYEQVQPALAGACAYCVSAYGVDDAVEAAGVELLDDYADHPSIRRLVSDGYQVITF